MKRTLLPSVLVFALALLAGQGELSEAAPMGTAFTYQASLSDAGSPADGVYDLEFKVYDDPDAGIQQGSTVTIEDLDVIDGSVNVELDFGSGVFDGEARWLEIGVRPGDSSGGFTTLSPRQKLTLTPYAIYAQTAGGDNDWALSGNDMYAIPSGKVGIGTTNPGRILDVDGHIRLRPGTVSNAGIWLTNSSDVEEWFMGKTNIGGTNQIGMYKNGWKMVVQDNAYVGIGTSRPETNLHLYKGPGGGSNPISSVDPVVVESDNNAYINVITPNNKWAGILFSDEGRDRGAIRYDHSADKMDFRTASTTRMAIDSSGRVGIGTTTPTAALHAIDEWTAVRGTANRGGNSLNHGGYFVANGSAAQTVYAAATSSEPTALNYGGYFTSAGGQGTGVVARATGNRGKGLHGQGNWVGVFGQGDGQDSSGVRGYGQQYDFYALGPGVDYGHASSGRWKSNVRPIDDPVGKVLRLRGVYFTWDAEHGGGHDVGMIAEEVGQVLPEIVEYEADGKYTSGMDYSKLTPLLVEAVKTLKIELDEQTKQQVKKDAIIERLGEENRALVKRLTAIESLVEQLAQDRKQLRNAAF